MTLEEALRILEGNVLSYSETEQNEAIRIASENGYESLADTARTLIENIKDEYNLTGNDPDEYAYNNDILSREAEHYTYKAFIDHYDNEDIAKILNHTEITDEDGKTALPEDKKTEYLNLLFQNAKLAAEIRLTGDKEFASKLSSQKREAFREEIKTIFLADFATSAIASQMDKPNSKERVINSTEYKDYVKRQSEKAQKIFRDIIDGGKKITVKADSILSSVADTAVSVENYVRALRNKAAAAAQNAASATAEIAKAKWNNLANKIQLKKNKLEEKAKMISDNRYEIIKNFQGSMQDNAWKIGTNIVANAGMGFWMGAAIASGGTAGPALIAYGAYHAASSWVWPIVKEYRKINRIRREKNQEKLGFKKAWKEAVKTATTGRNKKKYIITGTVNSVLGVGLMGWGATMLDAANVAGAANEATSAAMSVAATKGAVRLSKTGAAGGAQVLDGVISKERSTVIAGLVGGTIGSALSFVSTGNGMEAPADGKESLEDVADNASGNIADASAVDNSEVVSEPQADTTTAAAAENTSSEASEPVADTTAAAETTEDAEDIVFPREYSSDMGISERQYNILVSTTEGTLKSATGEEVTLDNAYANLDEEAMAHFPGKTKEEVMFKFNRLYAFMRKAYESGNGTFRETPSGAEYLQQKFGSMNLNLDDSQMKQLVSFAEANTYADKKSLSDDLKEMFPEGMDRKTLNSLVVAIHSNQRFYQNAAEMEALVKLLGCGDKITAEQGAAINALLNQTDSILSNGNSNAQLTGLNLSKGCEDDDGEWRRTGAKPVSQPKPEPVAEPEPVAKPEPEPEPARRPIEKVSIPAPQAEITVPMAQGPENVEIKVPVINEPAPEPEPEKMKVRKMTGTRFSDFSTGNADKQEIVSDAKAERLLKKYHPNGGQSR